MARDLQPPSMALLKLTRLSVQRSHFRDSHSREHCGSESWLPGPSKDSAQRELEIRQKMKQSLPGNPTHGWLKMEFGDISEVLEEALGKAGGSGSQKSQGGPGTRTGLSGLHHDSGAAGHTKHVCSPNPVTICTCWLLLLSPLLLHDCPGSARSCFWWQRGWWLILDTIISVLQDDRCQATCYGWGCLEAVFHIFGLILELE